MFYHLYECLALLHCWVSGHCSIDLVVWFLFIRSFFETWNSLSRKEAVHNSPAYFFPYMSLLSYVNILTQRTDVMQFIDVILRNDAFLHPLSFPPSLIASPLSLFFFLNYIQRHNAPSNRVQCAKWPWLDRAAEKGSKQLQNEKMTISLICSKS